MKTSISSSILIQAAGLETRDVVIYGEAQETKNVSQGSRVTSYRSHLHHRSPYQSMGLCMQCLNLMCTREKEVSSEDTYANIKAACM